MIPPKVSIRSGPTHEQPTRTSSVSGSGTENNARRTTRVNLHTANATDALLQWRSRRVFPTEFGSFDLGGLSAELRRRVVFSARVTNAGFLEEVARVVDDMLSGKINRATGRWELLKKLKQLGYDPAVGFPEDMADVPFAERDSLQDISSQARLDLILKTNEMMAANYGRMVAGNTPYARHYYPAWELVRILPREVPRGWKQKGGRLVEDPHAGWPLRWEAAGGTFYRGRMIAPKDSPVWQALGDGAGGYEDTLNNPYPPFAFQSGMGWNDVGREECIRLGVIAEDETPGAMEGRLEPDAEELAGLEALAAILETDLRGSLAEHRARQGRIARDAETRRDEDLAEGKRMLEAWMR